MSKTRIEKRIEDLERKESPRAYIMDIQMWGSGPPDEVEEIYGSHLLYVSQEDYDRMVREGKADETWEALPASEAKAICDEHDLKNEAWEWYCCKLSHEDRQAYYTLYDRVYGPWSNDPHLGCPLEIRMGDEERRELMQKVLREYDAWNPDEDQQMDECVKNRKRERLKLEGKSEANQSHSET